VADKHGSHTEAPGGAPAAAWCMILLGCCCRCHHVPVSASLTFACCAVTCIVRLRPAHHCPRLLCRFATEFLNAVILREPIPHAVSLMAEAKYRYVRQLQFRHHITAWQPPAWNLTWWETFGPALVGNYATRTFIGRDSFCRSAANISHDQLHEAVECAAEL